VTRWAYQLGSDGKGHVIDPAAACAMDARAGGFTWVHLDGNDEATLGWLQQHAGLPDTVAFSLTARETRPRTEPIADGALINLRGPVADGEVEDRLASIRLWIEKGRVISIAFYPVAGLDQLCAQMKDGEVRDPGDLVSHLAMIVTKRLDPIIADLGDLVDDSEEEIDAAQAYATRRKIARARSDAIAYRRFVAPQREALQRLAELPAAWLEDDDRLHLREAADRFARMAEELEAVRERAALIHEQLTDLRSEQIEGRALVISVVALIFLPLTFITGLLGMNVDGIPFAHEPWAFEAVCAICLAVAGGVTGWFVWQKWLADE
jgi:zinc transporter